MQTLKYSCLTLLLLSHNVWALTINGAPMKADIVVGNGEKVVIRNSDAGQSVQIIRHTAVAPPAVVTPVAAKVEPSVAQVTPSPVNVAPSDTPPVNQGAQLAPVVPAAATGVPAATPNDKHTAKAKTGKKAKAHKKAKTGKADCG